MRGFWLRLFLTLMLVVGLVPPVTPVSADDSAHPRSRYRPGEILVKVRDGVIIQEIDTSVRLRGTLGPSGIMYLGVPAGEELAWAARLARSPHVEFAQPNWVYQLDAAPDDPLYPNQWGLDTVGAPAAWDVTTGDRGVLVAVVDSGTDPAHPDLAGAIWTNPREVAGNGVDDDGNGYVDDVHGWNFISNNNDVRDDMDRANGSPIQSHGTHVSGIIAARLNNGAGVAGLAGTTTILPVKAGNSLGELTSESAYRGIVYAANQGARVINLSFGSFEPDSAVADAITYALGKGAVLVAAAGNCGAGCTVNGVRYENPFTYPASLSGVLAVSNLGRIGTRWATSEHGPYIAVAAPGQSITSTLYAISTEQHYYGPLTGTSMAAPHVAALAALILSVNPDLTNSQVSQIITSTASLAPSRNDDLGYGVINAAAAVRAAPHQLRLQEASLAMYPTARGNGTTARLVNPGTAAGTWQPDTATPWLKVGAVTGTTPSYAVASIDLSRLPTTTLQTGFITVTSRLMNTVVSSRIVTVTARYIGGRALFLPVIVARASGGAGW